MTRPPRWAAILLVLLVVANVATLYLLFDRRAEQRSVTSTETAVAPAAGSTSADPSAALPTQAADPVEVPVLAVYGDGYAAGNQQGGLGAAGWPALVAAATGSTLSLHAVSRAGYVSLGVDGRDYPSLVRDEPVAGAAVTVVVGSRNDAAADPAVVAAHATALLADVRRASPDGAVVVIGPIWSSADAPAALEGVSQALAGAVQAAGATFVDPIAEGWFAEGAGLIAGDGISPTDAGHAYLAGLVEPVVRSALAASPTAATD